MNIHELAMMVNLGWLCPAHSGRLLAPLGQPSSKRYSRFTHYKIPLFWWNTSLLKNHWS